MKNKKILVIFLVVIFILAIVVTGIVLKINSKTYTSEDVDKIEEQKQLSFIYNNKTITMEMPENWEYEMKGKEEENNVYLVKIYPNKDDKEKYIILNEDSSFGVCGTGLETESMELNNGIKASIGYYRYESDTWQFVTFNEYEKMYLWSINLTEEEGNIALEMIKTLQYN
ncbi:MAG: hypothetical protein J6M60_01795 [Clostridia bacterium]|nr:hypothetical protein [Clostridia bacterium]